MPIINLSEYYNEEHTKTINEALAKPMFSWQESLIYRQLIEENREYSGFNMNRVISNAEAHLSGAFRFVLGKEVAFEDVTVDDVRTLADRFMMNGERYPTRGEDIHDKNFKNVLYEISMLTTVSLYPRSDFPRVGFLDAQNEPLAIYPDSRLPKEPDFVAEPKAPGRFKTFMHEKFNLYKNTFAKYEADLKKYNKYISKKTTYDNDRNTAENVVNKNKEQGVELWNAVRKELAGENVVENNKSRQLDHSISEEINNSVGSVTPVVEPSASVEKVKENN